MTSTGSMLLWLVLAVVFGGAGQLMSGRWRLPSLSWFSAAAADDDDSMTTAAELKQKLDALQAEMHAVRDKAARLREEHEAEAAALKEVEL